MTLLLSLALGYALAGEHLTPAEESCYGTLEHPPHAGTPVFVTGLTPGKDGVAQHKFPLHRSSAGWLYRTCEGFMVWWGGEKELLVLHIVKSNDSISTAAPGVRRSWALGSFEPTAASGLEVIVVTTRVSVPNEKKWLIDIAARMRANAQKSGPYFIEVESGVWALVFDPSRRQVEFE